jgi:hypothetical protein
LATNRWFSAEGVDDRFRHFNAVRRTLASNAIDALALLGAHDSFGDIPIATAEAPECRATTWRRNRRTDPCLGSWAILHVGTQPCNPREACSASDLRTTAFTIRRPTSATSPAPPPPITCGRSPLVLSTKRVIHLSQVARPPERCDARVAMEVADLAQGDVAPWRPWEPPDERGPASLPGSPAGGSREVAVHLREMDNPLDQKHASGPVTADASSVANAIARRDVAGG